MEKKSRVELKERRRASRIKVRVLLNRVTYLEERLRQERRMSQELREQLALRKVFINQMAQALPAALYLYSLAEQTEVFFNDRLYQMLQYPPEEIGGLKPRLLDALLHPDDKPRLLLHHEQLRNAPVGPPGQIELRLRARNGQWTWVRVQDTVFARDANGRVEQLLGTIQDIHAEKAFTEQLLAQKDFFEIILNNIPAGISVFDATQTCRFVNQREVPSAALQQQLVGQDLAAYCQAQPWEEAAIARHHAQFHRALETRQEVAWEESPTPNVPTHRLRKCYPVLGATGEVAYLIGYGVDITQRKQIEQQLANEQALVRQVIAANPNPMCVQDESGTYILANEAYAQLHNLSMTELLGHTALATDSLAQDLALLESGTSVSFEALHTHHLDGQEAWYHTTKKPFIRPDGTRYLLTIATDITDLKRARVTAEESMRAKEIFLANMSHEIRTPMNGIVGLSRLLKKQVTAPEQREYLDLVLSNAESLLVVINDILDFAKIESGKVDLESIPFDVGAAVHAATKSLGFQAEAKGLSLQAEVEDEPLPTVEGDPGRLNQVLVNLINNAIKFTSTGEVLVTAGVAHQEEGRVHLRFCVEDTGIGISPDKFDQVFKSFGQANTSTNRLYGGTGLGLAICKSLVELQGGRIWLDSQPGAGSRFYVQLPYRVSEQPPLEQHPPQPLAAGLLQGLRVLLVEDNSVNTFLARALLRLWEVEADVASDGEQAVAMAHGRAYDLILMDIQMPRMNGLDATRHLRHVPNPNQHTPIIALTANAIKCDLDSYAQAGFTDCLVKPYHENSLYLIIARNTGRASRAPASLAPVAAPATPLFGFEGLGRLAQDAAFVRKMQQLFVDTVPGQVAQLGAAVACQDWAAAQLLVHTLKSTYGNLQISEAQRYMKKFEEVLQKNPEPAVLANLLRTTSRITNQITDVFTIQLSQ
ncbi:ATP-binding protein [Hymenobacter sp. BT770]|uniref:ATP-binding protein n=1 Tax=Hymenobacter sp. BT770 TaxID=2886942 RepID=UPI001D116149|nr:ATP-binding protein [Hymenobacter sp. BT770]MCC3155126.1 PAS domain-containing protein [Hymenobacter sp. BT770]MDO3417151.1 ATP-binding protein [Hymenobacter sp. BT770]